jgi:YidC/Oxa1 family membrane protein insertase
MDDKRPLLAIVLILLVFLGFNYYHALQRQARMPEQDAPVVGASEPSAGGEGVAPGAVDAAPSSRQETAAERVETPPDRTGAEEITVVETPLWVARFSNRGGMLLSWQLKEYASFDGEPVELVSGDAGALGVELLYGAERLDTSSWIFEGPGAGELHPGGEGSFSVLGFRSGREEGVRVVKEYTVYPDRYSLELYVNVAGLDDPSAEREMVITWPGVLPTEEAEDARTDRASVALVDGKANRRALGKLRDDREALLGEIDWATSQSKYFMAAVVPIDAAFSRVVAFADTSGEAVGFEATLPIPAGESFQGFQVYAGPQDYAEISAMGTQLGQAVYLGWPWIRPMSTLVLKAIMWAHGVIPNYGLVIILFSVLTKLLFYRLTHKSFTEMKRMQELQPRLKELQAKHANNREELSKAQMRLYKEAGVNPLGSCLPMLLQMPVFIALFQVLRTTIELRGAPFMLWMSDLSQPDTIATVAGFSIHILPLLMGVGMLVQQKFSSSDPSQAAMGRIMPVVFTVIFYNMASGLVLYWLVNTVLSIAQQYYIHRGPSAEEASRGATAPKGVPGEPIASSAASARPSGGERSAGTPPTGADGTPKKSGSRRRRRKN